MTIKHFEHRNEAGEIDYQYSWNPKDGMFMRWGNTLNDDPQFSPVGPEIADIEISTVCHGVGKPCQYCFPSGTLVKTKHGFKDISDIEVNEEIYSAVENNKKFPYLLIGKIEETYSHPYEAELVVLTFEDDTVLRVTPEHLIYTQNRGWVEAGFLTLEDDLVSIAEFKKCKQCGKLILYGEAYKRYYCSEECYEQYNKITCLICGSSFLGRRGGRFCTECTHIPRGMSYHPLRNIWDGMLRRCYDKSRVNYKNYGGRGITVCERWHNFENFIQDVGERPSEEYTLDRINSTEGYCKENCRWATVQEQRLNRKRWGKRIFKGVSKNRNKWIATMRHDNMSIYIGSFSSAQLAAEAHDRKMMEFYPDSWWNYSNFGKEHYEN